MDCSIPADLLAHPSKPAVLKPTPGALRRVAGSPSLRLLPLLCDHAALAGEAIPKLPLIVAPSVGAPFVTSCSLQAGSDAGCMGVSYLRVHTTRCGQSHLPAGLACSAMTGVQPIQVSP
jgi:hypothetical protein